jgi:plastocyanin
MLTEEGSGMFMRIATATILIAAIHSTAEAAQSHTVTMAGMAYAPPEIAARVGDSIRFVNDDVVDHDVFVPTVGHAIDLGAQKPATETAFKLGKSGRFEVECVFHDQMKLVVEVQP